MASNTIQIFAVKTGEMRGFFAIIKKSYTRDGILYNTAINFGGLYDKCVEVTIFYKDGIAYRAKINNILSEPECGIFTLLSDGETVFMIKCMFAFIRSIPEFQNVREFDLEDMSHIYCDKDSINYEKTTIPRRGYIRLGLPFFYIAYHQKTWYEEKFGARMVDANKITYKKYENYRTKMENFNKSINMDFLTFASRFGLNTDQYRILEPLYNSSSSYADFFKKIKYNKCNILYNWIESFIRYILEDSFDSFSWVINIDNVEHIQLLNIVEKSIEEYNECIPKLEKCAKRNLKTYKQTQIRKREGGAKKKTRKNKELYRFAFKHEG